MLWPWKKFFNFTPVHITCLRPCNITSSVVTETYTLKEFWSTKHRCSKYWTLIDNQQVLSSLFLDKFNILHLPQFPSCVCIQYTLHVHSKQEKKTCFPFLFCYFHFNHEILPCLPFKSKNFVSVSFFQSNRVRVSLPKPPLHHWLYVFQCEWMGFSETFKVANIVSICRIPSLDFQLI